MACGSPVYDPALWMFPAAQSGSHSPPLPPFGLTEVAGGPLIDLYTYPIESLKHLARCSIDGDL